MTNEERIGAEGDVDAHVPFERLNDYADALLPAAERAEVERHLAACPACRADLAALARLLALAAAPQVADPPDEVWAAVRARIAPAPRLVPSRGRPWRWPAALAAAALAIASVPLVVARLRVAPPVTAAVTAGPTAADRPVAVTALDDNVVIDTFHDTLKTAWGDSVAVRTQCVLRQGERDLRCVRSRHEPGIMWLARSVAGALRLDGPAPPARVLVPVPSFAVMRQTVALDRAATELASTVRGREQALPQAARVSLTRSLGVVDTAVAEARAALLRDPGEPAVIDALAAVQGRRVELLRQAARLLSED